VTPAATPDRGAEGSGPITLIRGGAIAGFGRWSQDVAPGSVAVRDGRVVAAGEGGAIDRRYAADARQTIDLPDRLLLPGLVNAHVHLELTDIGPRPYGGDFVSWVREVIRQRPGDAAAAGRSIRHGAARAAAAGVEAIGDIGGPAWTDGLVERAMEEHGLAGVAFREFLGRGEDQSAEHGERLGQLGSSPAPMARITVGLQPHAPYSTPLEVYRWLGEAAEKAELPLCTHLAETREEAVFIAEAAGPFRQFLDERGVSSPQLTRSCLGEGLSPVGWLAEHGGLGRGRWLLAHGNYVSDADIETLAGAEASVAYCPLASEYFGHHGHRYREMLEAGVNVCLGSDSIICQPPNEVQPLGILAPMRRLYRRDGECPSCLLRMATEHGRRALALNDEVTRLAAVGFDPTSEVTPLRQIMQHDRPAQAIDCRRFGGSISGLSETGANTGGTS
jgi:cytosine/adenosine deaminase-related metal-dependent hydrolase